MIRTPNREQQSSQPTRGGRPAGGTVDSASTSPQSDERNDAMNVMTTIAAQRGQDDGIGRRSALAAARRAWDAAFADFEAKRAALAVDDHDEDLNSAHVDAMDRLLIDVPAPDATALKWKLQEARSIISDCEPHELTPKIWDALIADAERLAATETGASGARAEAAPPANHSIYEDILQSGFEAIETMVLTLHRSQLFMDVDDHESLGTGGMMFELIVERVQQTRTEIEEHIASR